MDKKIMRGSSKKRANNKKNSVASRAHNAEHMVSDDTREIPLNSMIEADSEKASNRDGSSWLNWDVIGISTTAVTLAGAAIFFVSGWFYEARWYGFYGLNISQLQLSPIDFMVQGIPGILSFLVAFSISWIIIRISKVLFQTFWSFRLQGNTLGIQFLNIILRNELIWVGLFAYLLLAVLDIAAEITLTLSFRRAYQTSYLTLGGISASLLILLFMILSLGSLRSNKILSVAALIYLDFFIDKQGAGLETTLKAVFRLLTAFVLAMTFILSISLSGILGQFDAISHRRSLSGWFVPQMIVTSEKNIPILESHRMESHGADEARAFTYGTFGLVASDDEKYYIVEYQAGRYQVHPKVYTVNKQSVDISFVIRDVAYLFDANSVEKPTVTPVPTSTPPPTQTETPIP